MANEGWVSLHRKFLDWEWYLDINVKVVFIHLLLCANHKDKNFKGQLVKRGQRITSYRKLAEETGLTVQNIRTVLKKLESTQEINIKSTHKNILVTVVNYGLYQPNEKTLTSNQQATNKQLTCNQHATNMQLTTNNNDNKDNNDNNDNNDNKKEGFSVVIKKYEQEIGLPSSIVAQEISNYLENGFDYNLINKAIEIAALNNKRNIKYVKGILNNLEKEGIKTLEAYMERKADNGESRSNSGEHTPKFEEYELEYIKTINERARTGTGGPIDDEELPF